VAKSCDRVKLPPRRRRRVKVPEQIESKHESEYSTTFINTLLAVMPDINRSYNLAGGRDTRSRDQDTAIRHV